MGSKVCADCLKRSKDENWYPFSEPEAASEKDCSFHPSLANWRTIRCLKTIRAWSLEPDGLKIAVAPGSKMTIQTGGGRIHERTARAKLFDYEGPFLDFLVRGGYLERHPGTPTTLSVTAKGDELIRASLGSSK